jgi:MoxR-like ATPase
VFLDELFNANSAILNNLLTVLNERVYRRGAETHQLPLLSLFSASNHLPEEEALAALFDRFLLRCRVEALPRADLPQLLTAGWALEQGTAALADATAVTTDELRALRAAVLRVDLAPVTARYADAVVQVRDLGVAFSDRRAVKVLKLVAASAVLCGRTQAALVDLWVLRYVWDRAEQIGPLGALVRGLLETAPAEGAAHPLASLPEQVSGADLARRLDELEARVGQTRTLLETARLREELASLGDQAAWVADTAARQHLLERADQLLERLGA